MEYKIGNKVWILSEAESVTAAQYEAQLPVMKALEGAIGKGEAMFLSNFSSKQWIEFLSAVLIEKDSDGFAENTLKTNQEFFATHIPQESTLSAVVQNFCLFKQSSYEQFQIFCRTRSLIIPPLLTAMREELEKIVTKILDTYQLKTL